MAKLFSPPAWGWSAKEFGQALRDVVLPTRVGMVRFDCRLVLAAQGSPHPRGDGPYQNDRKERRLRFSPPAWGWSERSQWLADCFAVLPTRVGMVRRLWWQR